MEADCRRAGYHEEQFQVRYVISPYPAFLCWLTPEASLRMCTAQHWRRVLAPNIHKGSWSAEEEEKLLQGVEKYGLTQWTLVAKAIPGRTGTHSFGKRPLMSSCTQLTSCSDIQCRYHYMRQQNSRACSWTLEEEKSLKKLVAKHGSENAACWVQVPLPAHSS